MKTSELTGIALDWAVASAEGAVWAMWRFKQSHGDGEMNYSDDWAQGGPLIERDGIDLYQSGCWAAEMEGKHRQEGTTPLIAAMRCFVASNLGDEVDIPKEFTASKEHAWTNSSKTSGAG